MDAVLAQKDMLRDVFDTLTEGEGYSDTEKEELFEKLESTIMLTIAAELFTNLDEEARSGLKDYHFENARNMFVYLAEHTPKQYFSEVVSSSIESVLAEFVSGLK